jgi:hypothetical protein
MPRAIWRGSVSQGFAIFSVISPHMSAVVPGHSFVDQHVAVTPDNIVA